jgi:hypothetical protein
LYRKKEKKHSNSSKKSNYECIGNENAIAMIALVSTTIHPTSPLFPKSAV